MDIEKLVNSKGFSFIDWLWRLMVMNVITIFISVVTLFVGFIPAYIATFRTIKDFKEDKKSGNIFKVYFKNIIFDIKKTMHITLVFLSLFLILGFAVWYYAPSIFGEGFSFSDFTLVYAIGFFYMLFCIFLLGLVLIHLPMVMTYFNFKVKDTLKMAFYMCFKFFVTTLVLLIVWGLSLGSLLLTFLIPFWFLIGISGPLFVTYNFTRGIYWYLSNNQDDIKTVEKYDLKGEEDD